MRPATASLLVVLGSLAGCAGSATDASKEVAGDVTALTPMTPMARPRFPQPVIPFAPRTYSVPKVAKAPVIDGKLDDDAWKSAVWTTAYVDILGDPAQWKGGSYPLAPEKPRFRTRGKMAWDDTYFYFAAELEEPHLWATYTERDSIIFHENDWEIFLDPDGDTHDYFEFEINVLNTVWDLYLVKPYRDGGPALHEWDAPGLRHAVHVEGTINDPSDMDRRWTIEVAWPWKSLAAAAGTACPPAPDDRWRVNFSRVQWHTRQARDTYTKMKDPKTGENMAEDNWVWSPQGLVNMHYPEMWGIVQFAPDDHPRAAPSITQDDRDRWRLRRAYYVQRASRDHQGAYTDNVWWTDFDEEDLDIEVFETGFEIILRRNDSPDLVIREDGHVREIERK